MGCTVLVYTFALSYPFPRFYYRTWFRLPNRSAPSAQKHRIPARFRATVSGGERSQLSYLAATRTILGRGGSAWAKRKRRDGGVFKTLGIRRSHIGAVLHKHAYECRDFNDEMRTPRLSMHAKKLGTVVNALNHWIRPTPVISDARHYCTALHQLGGRRAVGSEQSVKGAPSTRPRKLKQREWLLISMDADGATSNAR